MINFEYIINLATNYNVSFIYLIYIYVLSIIPIYGGFFLMLWALGSKISLRNIIFRVRRSKLAYKGAKNIPLFTIGLLINIFGWLAPYLYLIFFSRGINVIVKLIALIAIAFVAVKIVKKLTTKSVTTDFTIGQKNILETQEVDFLWDLYDKNFQSLNQSSPCRQSYHREDFFRVINSNDVRKFCVYNENKIVAFAMISNNLKHSTWISEDYYAKNFSYYHSKSLIYYFLGIAVDAQHRRQHIAMQLLQYIFNQLPESCIIGFDHSSVSNPHIKLFPYLAKTKSRVKVKYLDSMRYYAVFKNRNSK